MKEKDIRLRKWLSGIALGAAAVLAAVVTVLVWQWLRSYSQEEFREYLRSFGPLGWLVLLGLQLLQVFVALIPGELLESAAGFAYGPVMGTVLCYGGIVLASGLVFFLVRRFGMPLVEVFVPREKLPQLRFLNDREKRDGLLFLLFFLPGTPKDFFTWFAGLTDISLARFLALTLVARIPSVLSSTFGGHLLEAGRYSGAILLYGITGAVSLGGLLLFRKVILPRKNPSATSVKKES